MADLDTTQTTKADDPADLPEPQEITKKAYERFLPLDYQETYVPTDSEAYKDQVQRLYSVIIAYKKHYKEGTWADCCFSFERRVPKGCQGNLGHPKDRTIAISDLIHQEGIHSQEALAQFFAKTLPKNAIGEVRLPQCNMKHKPELEVAILVTSSLCKQIKTRKPRLLI